jgi:hypothetical protein
LSSCLGRQNSRIKSGKIADFEVDNAGPTFLRKLGMPRQHKEVAVAGYGVQQLQDRDCLLGRETNSRRGFT